MKCEALVPPTSVPLGLVGVLSNPTNVPMVTFGGPLPSVKTHQCCAKWPCPFPTADWTRAEIWLRLNQSSPLRGSLGLPEATVLDWVQEEQSKSVL